jgi:hypothetical protein
MNELINNGVTYCEIIDETRDKWTITDVSVLSVSLILFALILFIYGRFKYYKVLLVVYQYLKKFTIHFMNWHIVMKYIMTYPFIYLISLYFNEESMLLVYICFILPAVWFLIKKIIYDLIFTSMLAIADAQNKSLR